MYEIPYKDEIHIINEGKAALNQSLILSLGMNHTTLRTREQPTTVMNTARKFSNIFVEIIDIYTVYCLYSKK